MSNKFQVILDDEDTALLKGLVRIFSALLDGSVVYDPIKQTDVPVPTEETPTRTRRSRADAGAASSSTEPASDAGASDGRRRRRTSEPEPAPAAEEPARRSRRSVEPEPTPPAAEEPVRRRRTAPAVEGISDAEVAKAASQAAAKITPAVVMQILKEDHGVTTANEIPQDERQKFLDTLKAEMAD